MLHTAEIRAELLRCGEDGTWSDNPLSLKPGDTVELTSIDFAALLVGFYRTA